MLSRFKMTKIIKLASDAAMLEKSVQAAASLLQDGKIIALPTDTVYGVAALSQCDDAIQAIYKLKGREFNKPIAICVGAINDIPKWGKIQFPKSLLNDLLPGPVTIVLKRQPVLNPRLNPNSQTIGIRIPKNKFIQDLAAACGEPLALTSANISSLNSTLAIEEFKEIWPYLDMIVDGGVLGIQDPHRKGSTIVDLSVKNFYKIIRPGCVLGIQDPHRKGSTIVDLSVKIFYKIIRPGCSLERTKTILQRYDLKELR